MASRMAQPGVARFMSVVVLAAAVVQAAAGCARGLPPSTLATPPQPSTSPAPEPGDALLRPELSADERVLGERLSGHIAYLADKLGERHPARPWELADAAEYVTREFEDMGYPVERQGYESDGTLLLNLSVQVSGGERGDQVLLVAAHYDSLVGDAGHNGGASNVAVLLELARFMRGAKLQRAIRFAAFSLGESPHGEGDLRGSRVYAREVARKKATEQKKRDLEQEQRDAGEIPASLPPLPVDRSRLVAMIALENLLGFRSDAGTRRFWVEVDATERAQAFAGAVARGLDEAPMLVKRTTLPLPIAVDSDAQALAEIDVPVVVVHGTGDRSARDLDALTRVTMGLRRALAEIGDERPEADFLAPGLAAP